jgi:cytochrome c553
MEPTLKLVSWIATVTVVIMARTALAATLYIQERDQALGRKPDLVQGARLFAACAACHKDAGGGTEDGSVPRIAGQSFSVLVRQLVDYRYSKRWDIRMESIASSHQLTDAQSIADVAGYVSRLPVPSHPGVGSGELVGHGARVYVRLCQSCHGPAGKGDGRHEIPQIAAQHYEYLLRQMHDAVEGRRPNFPPAHIKLLGGLIRDDLVGLADFLSRSVAAESTSQGKAAADRGH